MTAWPSTRARLVLPAALLMVLCACSGGVAPGATSSSLHGYTLAPPPSVGDLSLPESTAADRPFTFRARPGGLLLAFFGRRLENLDPSSERF